MTEWSRLKRHPGWHTYWTIGISTFCDGDDIEVLFPDNDAIVKGVVRKEKVTHEGRGGMDESYSWERLYLIYDLYGRKVSIVLEEGWKARIV